MKPSHPGVFIKTTMAKNSFRTFDQVEEEYYREHPDEIESYLKVCFEEYAKDGATSALLCSSRMFAGLTDGCFSASTNNRKAIEAKFNGISHSVK